MTDVQPSRTVVDFALGTFRGAIRDRELLPGERIDQAHWAERLGVSIVVVREALRSLSGEGLVDFRAHKGVFLRGLSTDDLAQIWELRRLIEPALARESCTAAADSTRTRAVDLLKEMESATESLNRYVDLHAELHRVLESSAQNRHLFDVVAQLRAQVDPYLREYLVSVESRRLAVGIHTKLVEAFNANDSELIAALTTRHMDVVPGWAQQQSGRTSSVTPVGSVTAGKGSAALKVSASL